MITAIRAGLIKPSIISTRGIARSSKAVLDFKDTPKLGDFLYYGHTLDQSVRFAFAETTGAFQQALVPWHETRCRDVRRLKRRRPSYSSPPSSPRPSCSPLWMYPLCAIW